MPEEEDRRRVSRERKALTIERTRHVNRIKGLFSAAQKLQLQIQAREAQIVQLQKTLSLDIFGISKARIDSLKGEISSLQQMSAALPAAGARVTVDGSANVLTFSGRQFNTAFDLRVSVTGQGKAQLVRAVNPDALRGTLQLSDQAAGHSWRETPQATK